MKWVTSAPLVSTVVFMSGFMYWKTVDHLSILRGCGHYNMLKKGITQVNNALCYII